MHGYVFLLSFMTFFLLNRNVGFMTRLNSIVVVLVLSLVCSFLPYGAITFLAGIVLLAHIASVSLELALLLLCAY